MYAAVTPTICAILEFDRTPLRQSVLVEPPDWMEVDSPRQSQSERDKRKKLLRPSLPHRRNVTPSPRVIGRPASCDDRPGGPGSVKHPPHRVGQRTAVVKVCSLWCRCIYVGNRGLGRTRVQVPYLACLLAWGGGASFRLCRGCLTGSWGANEGARHTIVPRKDSAGEGGLGSANKPSMPSSWRRGDGEGVSLSPAVAEAAFVVGGRRFSTCGSLGIP